MQIINSLVDIALAILVLFPLIFKYRKMLEIYQRKPRIKSFLNHYLRQIVVLDDLVGLGIIISYYILKFYYELNFLWIIIIFLLIIYAILGLRNCKVKLVANASKSIFTFLQLASLITFYLFTNGLLLYFSLDTRWIFLYTCVMTILGKYLITLKFFSFDKLLSFIVEKILFSQLKKKKLETIFVKSKYSSEFLNICAWQISSNPNCYISKSNHPQFCDYLEEVLHCEKYKTSFTYYNPSLEKLKSTEIIKNIIIFDEKNMSFSYNRNNYLLNKDYTFLFRKINRNQHSLTINFLSGTSISLITDAFYKHNQQLICNVITSLILSNTKYKLLTNNRYFENGNLYEEEDIFFTLLQDCSQLQAVTESLPTNFEKVLYIEHFETITPAQIAKFLKLIPHTISNIIYVGKSLKLINYYCQSFSFLDKLYLYTDPNIAQNLLKRLEIKKPYYIIKVVLKENL